MARILIVDDERDVVEVAKIMLEWGGHETDFASEASSGFDKLKSSDFDLVLLDVMMPKGINGWELCEKIKKDEETRDTPVVMFTVRTSHEDHEKGMKCGAVAQVDKPFGRDYLLDTVDKVLKEQ